MIKIKEITRKSDNTTFRVRKLNETEHYIIELKEKDLWVYLFSVDSEEELNQTIKRLTDET